METSASSATSRSVGGRRRPEGEDEGMPTILAPHRRAAGAEGGAVAETHRAEPPERSAAGLGKRIPVDGAPALWKHVCNVVDRGGAPSPAPIPISHPKDADTDVFPGHPHTEPRLPRRPGAPP